MLKETVSGIVALHNFSPPILHRDLKTLNVLVTADLQCKVCDFGLSRFATDVETLLKCRGTLAYIASEVYHQKGFFPASDIYSIAIMMWEVVNRAITGEYLRPYHDIKMEFVILTQAHQKGRRPPLPDILPNSFRDLITLCWDPDYEKRPDAKKLLSLLQQLHDEYHMNLESWDKVCYATKTKVEKVKNEEVQVNIPLTVSLPLPVAIGQTEQSVSSARLPLPLSVSGAQLTDQNGASSARLPHMRPQLLKLGGGSISRATARAAMGINISNG